MEIENMQKIIEELIRYWENIPIPISAKSSIEIQDIIRKKKIHLPNDFKKFYESVNGMETLYPNEMDPEGFLFYPIEAIVNVREEFLTLGALRDRSILIFAEYMHKSWWYGFESAKSSYNIGMISSKDEFRPITNSLASFIKLYMKDSPELY